MAQRLHTLSSRLTFGKYRGIPVSGVLRFNPQYLLWAAKNLEWFKLDADAEGACKVATKKLRNASSERQNAWAWGFGKEARAASDAQFLRLIDIEQEERRKAGQWLNDDLEWCAPAAPSHTIQQEG